ncbi:nucleoside diphosphate kinase [Pelomyxa schiedti]|nr:nucleoside diphosphate kinase [Pelomyxa schiedti]
MQSDAVTTSSPLKASSAVSRKIKDKDKEKDDGALQGPVVDMSNQQLGVIPPATWLHTSCTKLDISGNALKVLSYDIRNLSNLVELNCSHNSLTSIPVVVCHHSKLTHLDCSSNLLTAIPFLIRNLNSLTSLDLSCNCITTLPDEIGCLSTLNTLSLAKNKLTIIPSAIGSLSQLKLLNLSWNKLTGFPPDLCKLSNLRDLLLSDNQLNSIPRELHNLTQTKVHISHDFSGTTPPEIFEYPRWITLGQGDSQFQTPLGGTSTQKLGGPPLIKRNPKQLSLVLIKPDAVERELIGEILMRLERKGLTIRAMKMVFCTAEQAREHYAQHTERPFFPSLLKFVTSAPLVAMVLEGNNAISMIRTLVGATDCCAAAPGTIRGDFGSSKGANLIHASDSLEAAQREIPIWFPEGILDWRRADQDWLETDLLRRSSVNLASFLVRPKSPTETDPPAPRPSSLAETPPIITEEEKAEAPPGEETKAEEEPKESIVEQNQEENAANTQDEGESNSTSSTIDASSPITEQETPPITSCTVSTTPDTTPTEEDNGGCQSPPPQPLEVTTTAF